MKAAGIDPSLSGTGVAGVDGAVTTVGGDSRKGDKRLAAIYTEVRRTCVLADLTLIEDLPAHAQGAGLTGLAAGAVRLALLHNAQPYLAVPPATLKKYATGKGGCSKADMRMALYQRTQIDNPDDNQVDAAWLRLMALDLLGDPLVPVPKSHKANGWELLVAQAAVLR